MNNKLLKGGLIATLPLMMMLAILPGAMPTAHADDTCLPTAKQSLDGVIEINANTENGLGKKLAGIEGKFLDGKITEAEAKVTQYQDKVSTLLTRDKITDETAEDLIDILDAFTDCIGLTQ